MDNIPIKIDGSDEVFVRPKQLAKILNIGERTIEEWARKHSDFPVLRLPRSMRVRPSEVVAWLEEKFGKGVN
jgi:excisionase family DNA binding protein